MTNSRRSIEVPGFRHGEQPIPAASRVGPIVATGGVHGLDPETGQMASDLGEQARLTFHNLQRILAAAGASLDDVVRITFHVRSPEAREAINAQWLAAFPDPRSRPARHTLVNEKLAGAMLLQCDALAWVDEHRQGGEPEVGHSSGVKGKSE